ALFADPDQSDLGERTGGMEIRVERVGEGSLRTAVRKERGAMKWLSRLAAAALFAGATAIDAQDVPRIAFEKYTLPNGLEVILHADHSVPLVAVTPCYKVGSADEKTGRTGFGHLFEHILFMGSESVPVGAFDQMLGAAGASNNG